MNAFTQIIMTDSQILDMVTQIETAQGRNEKEAALASMAATKDGREMINLCYNSFLTWGLTCREMPDIAPNEELDCQFPAIKAALMRLAARDVTGHEARALVFGLFARLNSSAQRLFWLCLNKDLKAGINIGSIKAVDPSLVPVFAVMRAEKYTESMIAKEKGKGVAMTFPVVGEPKFDGYRVTFVAKDGGGGFYTRTGKVIADLDHMIAPTLQTLRHWFGMARITNGQPNPTIDFIESLSQAPVTSGVPNMVLDGEMMPNSGKFNDIKGAMKAGDVCYRLFDCLSWSEFDAVGAVPVTYVDRRGRVSGISRAAADIGLSHKVDQTPMEVLDSHEEIQEAYQRWRNAKQEGLMVKDPNGFYEKRKSRSWLKIKNEDTEDLPIIGVFQGQIGGKYENTTGGLIVDRDGVEVRVSGIDDATRAEIWQLWGETCNSVGVSAYCGYEGRSFKLSSTVGPLLGRLIEVEFHEVTPDGSLRHPRFIRFRDDKTGEVDK